VKHIFEMVGSGGEDFGGASFEEADFRGTY